MSTYKITSDANAFTRYQNILLKLINHNKNLQFWDQTGNGPHTKLQVIRTNGFVDNAFLRGGKRWPSTEHPGNA